MTRIYCGKCGAPMRRFKKKNTDWRCGNRVVGQNCDMEIVKESEIHKAIVTAFNQLRFLLPELIKEEAKVHNGEMKSIDAILEHLTEEEETLTSSDGEALDRIESEKNRLFHKRADLANQLVLIRDLREFAERKKPTEDDGSPCSSYEDFFDRTCYVPPKSVVDSFGEVLVFDNGMAQRFLERVMVYPEKLVVGFKAGAEVEVER